MVQQDNCAVTRDVLVLLCSVQLCSVPLVPTVCESRRRPVARRPFDSWELFWKVTVNAVNGVCFSGNASLSSRPKFHRRVMVCA